MGYCLWCGDVINQPVTWARVFTISRTEVMVCQNCMKQLDPIQEEICVSCGRDLRYVPEPFQNSSNRLCFDCERWEHGHLRETLLMNRALYTYNDFLKEVMSRYKFRGYAIVVQGFKNEWMALYRRAFPTVDLRLPIPLSSERLYERGFNQAYLLAELLGDSVTPALKRIKHEAKQSKKTRLERLNRQDSPFIVNIDYQAEVKNKTILLIDDVYTTGTTLRWAAKTLLEHGAGQVFSMTLAHG